MCEWGHTEEALSGKESEALGVRATHALRGQAGGDPRGVGEDWILGVCYGPFLDLGAGHMWPFLCVRSSHCVHLWDVHLSVSMIHLCSSTRGL